MIRINGTMLLIFITTFFIINGCQYSNDNKSDIKKEKSIIKCNGKLKNNMGIIIEINLVQDISSENKQKVIEEIKEKCHKCDSVADLVKWIKINLKQKRIDFIYMTIHMTAQYQQINHVVLH